MLDQPPGALAAHVGEVELVVVHRRRAAMNHQLIELHLPQQFVEQHERQLHLFGDVAAAGVAARQQELERQLLDLAFASAWRRGTVAGSRGMKMPS